MPQAFIIMPIGNPELDKVAASAIVPALVACGLDPKRVDKHNAGGLLKAELIGFINEAEIIVADLTLERPNCYLEIGYAMGVDKFKNLILTVREDHFQDSPNHKKGGPKIHFDLSGYDILRWYPADIDGFRAELEKRIRRRLAIIAAPAKPVEDSPLQDEWLAEQIAIADAGLKKVSRSAFMELRFSLTGFDRFSLPKLREAAARAPIHTAGWPIAVFLQKDGFRPHPRADGIAAEILREQRGYDYWALRRNGDFFWRGTLREDNSEGGRDKAIFFDTRINRVTEALLYCARLYSELGLDRQRVVDITVRHVGLRGRQLSAENPNRILEDEYDGSHENETVARLSVRLEQIESDLVPLVKQVLAPLFALFDFFELNDRVYADIANKFVARQA